VALAAVQAGIVAVGAALSGVGAAIATWFLPVTAAIAGVILAVYLLKRAWETNFGGIRDTVLGAWNKIRLVFEGIKALIGTLSGGMGQMSAELANKLKAAGLLGFVVTVFKVYYRVREALAGLWGAFAHAFERIRAILGPVVGALMSAFGALFRAVFSVTEIFGIAAGSAEGSTWRGFGVVIGTVAGVLLQGLAFALKIVAWNLTIVFRALAIVVRAFVWTGKVIVGALVHATRFIYKFLLPVRLITAAFIAAGKIIYAVWQVLTGDISLLEGLKAIGGAVFDFLATPFRWARDVIVGVWNFISGIFTSIGHLVTNAAATIGDAFLDLPIISTLRDLFATIRSFFAGDTTFFEAGKKLLITLGEGIWSAVTYPFTMLKNALSKLRGLLPFSDAKEGPLSNLTASGAALLRTLAEGIGKAKSLPAEQVSESLLNLVPRLDGRLLPKALSAMLMLQPVMAQALPSQLPMSGIVQSVTSAVEPVNRFSTMEPGRTNAEKISTSHSQIPSEQLAMAGRNSPNAVSAGAAESGQDLRGLLSAVLSRIDALADRPIELNVTTTIDGRKVAEAVYKDLREKKIRNYETL
jgi:hypothetical protein